MPAVSAVPTLLLYLLAAYTLIIQLAALVLMCVLSEAYPLLTVLAVLWSLGQRAGLEVKVPSLPWALQPVLRPAQAVHMTYVLAALCIYHGACYLPRLQLLILRKLPSQYR